MLGALLAKYLSDGTLRSCFDNVHLWFGQLLQVGIRLCGSQRRRLTFLRSTALILPRLVKLRRYRWLSLSRALQFYVLRSVIPEPHHPIAQTALTLSAFSHCGASSQTWQKYSEEFHN
jgi:hypothetical protein